MAVAGQEVALQAAGWAEAAMAEEPVVRVALVVLVEAVKAAAGSAEPRVAARVVEWWVACMEVAWVAAAMGMAAGADLAGVWVVEEVGDAAAAMVVALVYH